ncbi:hypothetical protein DPMN_069963 [Dreissena polymorpha]|uniref:Uncharacterized protein n=1 Tax=Dreissena polymorpha TaxID=45954 RepID=A0A9D4BVB6_DREPO|nr:hypothetical protein DPMN_069963 [Dreissena polymorpha]
MEISNFCVFVLMLFFKLVGVSSPCPAECLTCDLNKQGEIIVLTCTNVQIQTLPNTVEDLQAKDLNIILPFGRFDMYILNGKSRLQRLEINNYHITSLYGECFKGCPGLLTLDLSNNEIMIIEEVNFAGLGNLNILNLNQNNVTTIGNFTFRNLPALKILSIVGNKLTSILKDDFTGLVKIAKIDLQHNIIKHINTEAFHSLQTLENLNLQHNNLTGIAAGVFSNLTSLRELNLQYNHIIILDPTSMVGTRLTKLDLWQNQISEVPTEFLGSIGHLGLTVNLAKNNITNIRSLAFNSVVLGT